MASQYWPVSGIRLGSGEVELRPTTEADLEPLAAVLPDDLETDPRLPTFGEDDQRIRVARALYQSYWSSVGTWRPEAWRLDFTVRVGGELAGVQEIEAEEFATVRTVETASWLATAWRGKGVGKAMRLAVLAFAFDGLGAEVAETEAWHDNAASLGVSRALGYVDNGTTRHARGDGADDMPRMRMTRAIWLSTHKDHRVRIDGVAQCRHMF